MGWAKFDDQYTDHPKIVAAGSMAELLDMRAVIHCARYETDGFVQAVQLPRIAVGITSPKKQAARLVEVGRWIKVDGGWMVHDFLDYHPSKADKEEEREKARERMANARKNKRKNNDRSSGEHPPNERKNNDRSSDNPVPAPAPPQEQEETTSVVPPDPNVSEDAKNLARMFVKAINANGHNAPKQGNKSRNKWLTEMDLLLRKGPPGEGGHVPDAAEVEQVIAWCAQDTGSGSYPGESVTVRSVPKFRERYSELRSKALKPGPQQLTNVVKITEGGRF